MDVCHQCTTRRTHHQIHVGSRGVEPRALAYQTSCRTVYITLPERETGLEPAPPAWRAGTLPLTLLPRVAHGNRTRIGSLATTHHAVRPAPRVTDGNRTREASGSQPPRRTNTATSHRATPENRTQRGIRTKDARALLGWRESGSEPAGAQCPLSAVCTALELRALVGPQGVEP